MSTNNIPMVARLRRISLMARKAAEAVRKDNQRKLDTLRKIEEIRRDG